MTTAGGARWSARSLGVRARARVRDAAVAAAAAALSRPVGLPTGRLSGELGSVWADVRRTRSARRALGSLRARGVLQTAADLDIGARKQSGTVFILGSGSSVNALTEADWEFIGMHDSIGFNHWLIRDFVPTYYFIELNTESLDEDEYLADLLCRRLPDLGDLPIIAECKCWLSPDGFSVTLPRQLSGRLYFYAPYYLRTTSSELVAWVLRHGRRLWHHGSRDLASMVHHRASLSALVLFAFLAGYDDIVLVGVDLNDSSYFWEEDSAILRGAPGPPTAATGAVHMTVDPAATTSEVAVPIDEYLGLLDTSVLRPAGVTLTVANPASRLASFLPVYPGLSAGAQRLGSTESPSV